MFEIAMVLVLEILAMFPACSYLQKTEDLAKGCPPGWTSLGVDIYDPKKPMKVIGTFFICVPPKGSVTCVTTTPVSKEGK